VDCLGQTVLECCDPARVIAILLTGMGHDGADSFAEIRKRGGRTIAESEESSVVFGMPAELIKRGGATVVLPSTKVAAQVNTWVGLS
jgi:two-component system chemotaxis response regulator CheB